MAFLLSKIDGNEINRTSSEAVGLEMTYVKHLARKGWLYYSSGKSIRNSILFFEKYLASLNENIKL